MPQKQLQPQDRARLDSAMTDLEGKVTLNPSDDILVDVLLTLQESYLPEKDGIGNYTDCQRQIFRQVTESDLRGIAANPESLLAHLKTCREILDQYGIYRRNNILQIKQGLVNKVNNEVTNCADRYDLFRKKDVLSRLCVSCYKVQILPAKFSSLMRLFLLMKYLDFPRDNFRKCMVELREYSPYAYKGVVYCQSEEEAEECAEIVRTALRQAGVLDVVIGLSHGCTEFGIAFPEFKYSSEGHHRKFQRPQAWDKPEAEFWASRPQHYVRPTYNSQGITIRDLICYHNWYHYAQLIGDPSCKPYDFLATNGPFEHLDATVAAQAQQRMAELAELEERSQKLS